MLNLIQDSTPQLSGVQCLVFGLGLIGSEVAANLQRAGFRHLEERPSSWEDRAKRQEEYAQLSAELLQSQWLGTELQFVWAAGSGSFSATESFLEPERIAFDDTLQLATELANRRQVTFHFISSAGALFEGVRLVGEDTPPTPRSAYGAMKLDQERALQEQMGIPNFQTVIYRPSTVYGSHEFHRRAGLVSHVMWNAIRSVPTTLEANVHALRDFVHYVDVGRYIALQVLNPTRGRSRIRFLVSAKPSSILEVFHRIERLAGRSCFYQLRSGSGNDSHITFSDRVLPEDWLPTALDVGLEAVWRETQKSFLREAPGV